MAALACLLYFLLTVSYPLPGYEDQWRPATYLSSFFSGFRYLFTFKGLYLNLLPVSILLAIAAGFPIKFSIQKMHLPALASLALMTALGLVFSGNPSLEGAYVIGRYAMHTLPFFIPFLVFSLSHIDKKD